MIGRAGLAAALLAAAIASPAQISENDVAAAQAGMAWERGHDAKYYLDQHRLMASALAGLRPQRPGIVDAYVIVIGMDGDPVFVRETNETAKVLSRRYDGTGRTMMLATGSASAPAGSPQNIAAGIAAIASKMDKAEDVLIVYATAHGAPGVGLVYKLEDKSHGMIAPKRLGELLDQQGVKRRMLMISACFSGQFVGLANPDSVIITASDDDRASFGCAPGNDWTFFGDALINHALRKPQPLAAATDEAFRLIAEWEFAKGLTSSKPRLFIGEATKAWLTPLEARIPPGATARVGRPSIDGGEEETAKK